MAEPSETDSQAVAGADAGTPAQARPHAILRYTTLRLGLFLAALALLWLVRVRDSLLLVAIALVLSGLASYVLLARHRDAMSVQLHDARERRTSRAAGRAAREDVDDSQ